jgi:hypothetical protein
MKKKTGRNEPCPCGSGKKFKKCCEKSMLGKKFKVHKIEDSAIKTIAAVGKAVNNKFANMSNFFANKISSTFAQNIKTTSTKKFKATIKKSSESSIKPPMLNQEEKVETEKKNEEPAEEKKDTEKPKDENSSKTS